MVYHAVGNNCGVDFNDIHVPCSHHIAREILFEKGFQPISIDIVELARWQIGVAKYRRGAAFSEAPGVVDCSSFTQWLYSVKGIELPRRSIQQRQMGIAINPDQLRPGDLVFVSGHIDYFESNPNDGVGHVGIATGKSTVIHAANTRTGVIETNFESFIKKGFRGIRRYIPNPESFYTYRCPAERGILTSDDFRWIILQNLPLP
jgi:hypothetical protein